MDSYGYHAGLCVAGGDRVVRHNGVRNGVFRTAKSAALRPELEKAQLLLPPRPDQTADARRRPADVYLPAWLNGSPAALDFAVTAPQRQEYVLQAAMQPLHAASAYAEC